MIRRKLLNFVVIISMLTSMVGFVLPQAASAASLLINPPSITFAPQQLGSQSNPAIPVTITNTNGGQITITNVVIANAGSVNPNSFDVTGNGCLSTATNPNFGRLANGEKCQFGVVLRPDTLGNLSARVRISSIDNAGTALPDSFVELGGTGTSPSVDIAPTSLDFTTQEVGTGQSPDQGVVIRNTGQGALTVYSPTLNGGNPSNFVVTKNTCGGTIGRDQTCEIRVAFFPKSVGTKTETLQIVTSANNTTPQNAQVLLTGAAIQGTISANPGAINFGDQQVNTISGTTTVTLTNTSGQTQTIPAIAIVGDTGTNFFITADNCTTQTLAPTTGTCTFGVYFRPASTGQKNAQVQVSRNPGGGPGVAPLLIQLNGNGVNGSGNVTIDPPTYTFPTTVPIGQQGPTQSFVVKNNGTGIVTVTNVFVNPNPNDFSIISYGCLNGGGPLQLGAGESCTIIIEYSPNTGTPTGQRIASLIVALSDTGGPPSTYNVAAAINATAADPLTQTATLTPNPKDFGAVQIGAQSAPVDFTFQNTGTLAIGPLGSAVFGFPNADQFSVRSDGCIGKTLSTNQTCVVSAVFKPTVAGILAASLIVPFQAGNTNPSAAASVFGNGTSSSLTIAPTGNDFGTVAAGYNSAPRSFTVTNTSNGPIALAAGAGALSDPALFSVIGNSCSGAMLNASGNGSTCVITVRFNPPTGTAVGAKSATLTVAAPNGVSAIAELLGNVVAPTAQVSLTPAPFDFGAVAIGFNSVPQTFTLTNTGTTPVILPAGSTILTPANPDFTLLATPCDGITLNPAGQPGSSCQVVVRFNPQTGPLGNRSTTLAINLGAGNGFVVSALNGQATAAPQQTATITPDPHDFGTVAIGTQSAPIEFTVRNTGSQPIGPLGAPASVGANADQFVIVSASDCFNKTLTTASPTCTFSAYFKPTAAGVLSAAVSVPFQTATTTPAASASVFGTGTSASATLTPDPAPFGTVAVGYSSGPQTFTLTNTSNGQIVVGAVALQGTPDFTLVKNDCTGTTLNAAAPGNTCEIIVTFTPLSGPVNSTKSGSLSVALPNNSVATAQLSGTPIAATAQATLTPSSANFGTASIGYNGTTQIFTLTNTGNTAITLQNPAAVIVPAPNADFTILAGGCDGKTLNPAGQQGNTCEIIVRFNPQAGNVGTRSASLAVNLGAGSGFAVAALTGQAAATPTVSYTLTPATQDFGTVVTGQLGPIKVFRLTNTSATLGLTVTAAAVLNSDNTNFTIMSDGCYTPAPNNRTLAPGDFCDIQVRFNPTTSGLKSTTLTISFPNGGAANASLFGTAITNSYTIEPAQLAFGDQPLGTASAPKFITITNTSNGTLAIGAITPPAGFILVSDLCTNQTLAIGAKCTVGVVFAPTGATAGPVNAVLSIAIPAGATVPAQVSLTGNITASPQGAVTLDPAVFNYGNAQVLTPSLPHTFTLTNNGTKAVTVNSVTIGGTNPENFSLVLGNNCTNAALNPGQSCSVQVVFRPTAVGALQATLAFATDAPGSPTIAALYGVGISPRVTVTIPTNGRLDFGNVQIGTQSTTQRVTVANSSNGPITFAAPVVDGNYFVVNDNCASKTLEAGATCTFDVLFAPTGTAGPKPGSVSINTAAVGGAPAGTYVVALYGVAITPSVAIGGTTNGRLDFGNIQVGTQSAAQQITVTNSTSGPITFGSPTGSTSPAFKVTNDHCAGQTIAAGANCTFDVYFAPTGAGAQSADITFTTGGVTYTVTAFGVGISSQVTITPNGGRLTFPDTQVGTQSVAQTITVTNGSGGPITVGTLGIAGQYLAFNDRCTGQTIPAGGTCTVGVIFAPTTAGPQNGTVVIPVGTSNYVVALYGVGITAVATLDQQQLDFGNVLVGAESAPKTVTLTNRSAGPLALGAVTSPDARYVVSADNCSNTTIGINGTCTFTVVFRPDQTGGIVNAQINVNAAATGTTLPSPLIVTVKGVGITAAATFSPVKLDFGNQPTNTPSGTQTITFTNSGTGPVSITGVAIIGTTATPTTSAPNDFQIVGNFCAPRNGAQVVLPTNGSCTISFFFQPTATGQRTALLQITTNSNGSPFTALLAGVGTTSSVSITPNSLDFGQQQVGVQTAPQTITVVNPTNGPLTISGVTLAGTNPGEFILSNDNCTNAVLGNGAGGRISCTVDVSFKPTSQGPKSAAARFTTSAPGGQLDVTLLGSGFLPVPVLQAAAVDFGNQVINTTSVAQTVTVTNRGPGTLQIDNVSITGANAGDFKVLFNNGCAGQLAPNQSCQVQVNFTPTALGQRQAFLTFNTNAAGNPNQTLLTGNGTPVPTYTTTVNVAGNVAGSGCTATISPAGPYQGNQQVTLTAQYNAATTVFIGWTLDGTFVGFANPLTFNVNNSSHNVLATCTPRPSFTDVNSGTPYNDAIIQMTARGFIRGYGDGTFGPNDGILRAQMAGITTRLAGWSNIVKPNIFTDRCIASGCVDDELWNSVAVTAFYQVARGYEDNTYRPFDPVANIQAVAFITRTMVKLGYWQFQPDNTQIYPNINAGTGHRIDISTYYYYAGAVPGTNPVNNWNEWDQNSTRAYFAGIYWQAYQSYFGVDRVP